MAILDSCRCLILYPLLVDEAKLDAASKVGGDGAVAQVSFSPSTRT